MSLTHGMGRALRALDTALRRPDRWVPEGVGDAHGEARIPGARARIWRGPWLWVGLVVVLFCIPLFVGLGRTDLENDEAIYSFAVDVILDSGNWLTPKSSPNEDVAFLEKPPLKFWIVAAPIKLGLLPHNEFGLRFWDAVFGSAAFVYVFLIGRRIAGPACGLVAVLALFVHQPLVFLHGLRTNNMEAALFLSYCGGAYHYLKWRAADDVAHGNRDLLAAGLFFVLGFMTKFVAAMLLPAVLLAAALLHREDRARLLREWRAILAVGLIATGLIAPWFLYAYYQFGANLWKDMGAHVFTRFESFVDPAHLQPWHHYLSRLLIELRESQVLVITIAGVALMLFRTLRSGWREGTLLLLWFGLPFVVISFGASKLYHYAYPFLPPLAVAAGYTFALVLDAARTFMERNRAKDRAPVAGQRVAAAVRTWRALLYIVAAGAALLALLTFATGTLRVGYGEFLLFRNSRILRPLLVALLAVALMGRRKAVIRIGVPLVLLGMLPLSVYRHTLTLLPAEKHPIRTLRDCLQPISAHYGGSDPRGPGVWVEDDQLTHPLVYYLRGLGPWQRPDVASDAAVFVRLYVPSRFQPVLLSHSRFDKFVRRVRAGDPVLIAQASEVASVDPNALAASARQVEIPFERFPLDAVMLPGPYGACAPDPSARPTSRRPR